MILNSVQLIPKEMFETDNNPEGLISRIIELMQYELATKIVEELLSYLDFIYDRLRDNDVSYAVFAFSNLQIMDFIRSIGRNMSKRNRALYGHYSDIRRKFASLNDMYSVVGSTDN